MKVAIVTDDGEKDISELLTKCTWSGDLSQGEETLYLPVTPAKVQIQSAQENKIVDILDFN